MPDKRPLHLKWSHQVETELKGLVVDILQLIRSLFSIKVIILAAMGYGCYLSNWNRTAEVFTGIMIFLFAYIRELQKPNSNLYKILWAWASHQGGSRFENGDDGGTPPDQVGPGK